jgi:hypothetical protein
LEEIEDFRLKIRKMLLTNQNAENYLIKLKANLLRMRCVTPLSFLAGPLLS